MFLKAARGANIGDFLASNLRYYIEDHKQGAFALGAPTNDVLEVTGHPAEDFETTARRYAAQPEAQRTFANWLRTLAHFTLTPLSPGYNPERLDRELRCPAPALPLLAMSNEFWKLERSELSVQHLSPERPLFSRPWYVTVHDHILLLDIGTQRRPLSNYQLSVRMNGPLVQSGSARSLG